MKLSTFQHKLLNELINRYERKQGYGKEESNKRRTIIDVKKYFPNYTHISNSTFKNEINFETKELKSMDFVNLAWEKYNIDDYLDKVYLNDEKLHTIYMILNRVPKKEKYEQVKYFVLEFRKLALPILIPLIDNVLNDLKSYGTPISIVDVDNLQLTQEYFFGLNELLKNKEKEISKRHWSIQLYNDSKRWEVLETKILNVIKKELHPEYDGLESATILGEFGVIENPKSIDIFGECIMKKDGKEIDFSIDTNGVGLYPSFFRNCEIIALDVERIITIENKTSYHDYLVSIDNNTGNELVIYLGGYHNHIRTLILKRLYEFTQKNKLYTPFYHWGDIDFGGLSILINLRKKTSIPFFPLYMDTDTFNINMGKGKEVKDKSYLKKLNGLLEIDEYKEFSDLIRMIIDKKVIIEQESITL